MCKKYSICEIVLGILVIIIAFWKSLPYQEWILTLIGVALVFHSFVCKLCRCDCDCDMSDKPMTGEKPKAIVAKSRTKAKRK